MPAPGRLDHTRDDRALGRVQVEADDIDDLVDEQRIVGELERVRAVRLEVELFQIRPIVDLRRLAQSADLVLQGAARRRSTTASTTSMPDGGSASTSVSSSPVAHPAVGGPGRRRQRVQVGVVGVPKTRSYAPACVGWPCSRVAKMLPPSSLATTIRRSGRGSSGPITSPVRSCRNVRSPTRAWVGPVDHERSRSRSRSCRRCRPGRGWRTRRRIVAIGGEVEVADRVRRARAPAVSARAERRPPPGRDRPGRSGRPGRPAPRRAGGHRRVGRRSSAGQPAVSSPVPATTASATSSRVGARDRASPPVR